MIYSHAMDYTHTSSNFEEVLLVLDTPPPLQPNTVKNWHESVCLKQAL